MEEGKEGIIWTTVTEFCWEFLHWTNKIEFFLKKKEKKKALYEKQQGRGKQLRHKGSNPPGNN